MTMTSEEIRTIIVKRLRVANDGRWYSLGCDSGYHSNTGRCDCEGGQWVEEENQYAYYVPHEPLYTEEK